MWWWHTRDSCSLFGELAESRTLNRYERNFLRAYISGFRLPYIPWDMRYESAVANIELDGVEIPYLLWCTFKKRRFRESFCSRLNRTTRSSFEIKKIFPNSTCKYVALKLYEHSGDVYKYFLPKIVWWNWNPAGEARLSTSSSVYSCLLLSICAVGANKHMPFLAVWRTSHYPKRSINCNGNA